MEEQKMKKQQTFGVMVGFVIMMALDNLLG